MWRATRRDSISELWNAPDDEAEVDLVLEDLVALGGRGEVGQLQPDIGIGEAELARDVGHQRMAGDRRVADPEDRLGARGEQADGVLGDADPAEDLLRLLEEVAAGFGEPDLAAWCARGA